MSGEGDRPSGKVNLPVNSGETLKLWLFRDPGESGVNIEVLSVTKREGSSAVCTSAYFNGGKSDSATCFEPRRGGGERDVTPGISES